MRLLSYFFRSAPWQLGFSVLAGIFSGLGSVTLIVLINAAIGLDLPSRQDLAWYFAGLCLLVFMARTTASILVTRLGQKAVQDLRIAFSRRILAAPLQRLQTLGAPLLLANLTDDVAVVAHAFEWVPILCINSAIVGGVLLYVGWLSQAMLGVVVAMMALGILFFRLQARRGSSHLHAAREHGDVLFGHLRGLTSGIKELKLNRQRRDAFLSEGLEFTAANYCRDYTSGITAYILASNWGQTLFYLVIGSAVFVLPVYFEMDSNTLTGCTLALLYMMSPLTTVLDGIPTFIRAGIALGKMESLGKMFDAAPEALDAKTLPFPIAVSLELSQVTHQYHHEREERPFTLGPLSLTVAPNEVVFIVGGNGSGKTTLALLLVGLYVPETGDVRLNGKRITQNNREFYRQHFSVVFSDFYLFESLSGFDPEELDGRALEYLQRLQLDHKVKIENGQLSTLDLSQGQRKRLALLAAYLEDRPFYVFDEWAADQDPLFKDIFYTQIIPSLKARGKTVIVITHDDQYFHLADRCLKLENGKIAAMPARQASIIEPDIRWEAEVAL